MFVGHGLLAFALVALAGRRAGWNRERALRVALLAGVFATIPDVDIAYALVGVAGNLSGPFAAARAFWATGNVVHRAVTHSLVVAPVVVVVVTAWAARGRDGIRSGPNGENALERSFLGVFAVGLAGALVVVATSASGVLAGVVMALFALAGLTVAHVAARHDVGPRTVALAALVGLATHPFGDLFTGEPPAMLYPFDATLFATRVTLHPDPTLHLLAAFGIELLTAWLALWALTGHERRSLRSLVSKRAAVGLGYAGAAFALPAPTLETSYQFVFSILAVGVVGPLRIDWPTGTGDPSPDTGTPDRGPVVGAVGPGGGSPLSVVATGLTAVTLAAVGYTLVYLVM